MAQIHVAYYSILDGVHQHLMNEHLQLILSVYPVSYCEWWVLDEDACHTVELMKGVNEVWTFVWRGWDALCGW